MQQYLDLLRDIKDNGITREDRTGTGTRGVFGRQMRFELASGFPLLTTKKLHLRSIIIELLWFLRGDTNIRWLQENKCRIWDEWADENGDLGPVYGKQWRSWAAPDGRVIDQIQWVLDEIKTNPNSRRLVVSAWNPADVNEMALPPCHCLFQFNVMDGKLNCQLYQRSADVFLGVPFNIALVFLRGDTNVRWLQENKCKIWDEWADENGDLGPVYGKQWRSWAAPDGRVIDQIQWVLDEIKTNPNSRRLVVSAWNPADVNEMALPPCHCLFQFNVMDGKLNCQLYQRSADVFLGVPFNIASYALLTLMMARATGLEPGSFVHTLGDAHLYLNHLEQAELQLTRKPGPLPRMILNPDKTDLFGWAYEDFTLMDYAPQAHIKAKVAV